MKDCRETKDKYMKEKEVFLIQLENSNPKIQIL